MSETSYTGAILTDVVEITSGPYSGSFGRLILRATGDRYTERGTVELDREFRFTSDESSAVIGGTLHVGLTDGPREIRNVRVGLSEYRRLTEAEMLSKYAG